MPINMSEEFNNSINKLNLSEQDREKLKKDIIILENFNDFLQQKWDVTLNELNVKIQLIIEDEFVKMKEECDDCEQMERALYESNSQEEIDILQKRILFKHTLKIGEVYQDLGKKEGFPEADFISDAVVSLTDKMTSLLKNKEIDEGDC